MAKHLIWDWNGTLLCDTGAVLEAVNEALAKLYVRTRQGSDVIVQADPDAPTALAELDIGPLTQAQYRAAFARPLQRFYDDIFGRKVTREEFLRLQELFHEAYLRLLPTCQLSYGAPQVLARWRDLGRTQSLLSLWIHHELLVRVAQFELTHYFARVDGRRDSDVDGLDSKTEPLRKHLSKLQLSGALQYREVASARDVVLVGDAVDDAVAAHAVGIGCVLFAGGTHEITELEATGAPVAHTLAEAVELADRLMA